MTTQDLDAPSVPLDSDERECDLCGAIYFVDEYSKRDCEED